MEVSPNPFPSTFQAQSAGGAAGGLPLALAGSLALRDALGLGAAETGVAP